MKSTLILAIVYSVLRQFSPVGAALGPGYEEELYCPQLYCRRPVQTPSGFVGPASAFNECYAPTTASTKPVTPWGDKLNNANELKSQHLEACMHTSVCPGEVVEFTPDETCVPATPDEPNSVDKAVDSQETDDVSMSFSWTNADGNPGNGTVVIELYPDAAPKHVANFLALVKDGYLNDTIAHRIIKGFMLQMGDFTNADGTGGHAVVWSGYCKGVMESDSAECPEEDWTLPDEADNGLKHEPYMLSMAKTGAPNTGGSQFFIVAPGSTPSHLDGVHTVFGKVIEGQSVIDALDDVETNGFSGSDPVSDVRITSTSLDADQGDDGDLTTNGTVEG